VTRRPGQLRLPDPPDGGEGDEFSLVYVASALTHLDQQGKLLIDAWCYVIKTAVDEASGAYLRTHLPVQWSDPGNVDDTRAPANIYELNAGKLREEVDALIVLGYRGGSLGAGQEFAWAASLRMPILYLRDAENPLSRQIEGTPADVTIVNFTDADGIANGVRGFIRAKRAIIQDGARRRRNRRNQFTAVAEAIRDAWDRLGDNARASVSSEARLNARRVEEVAGNPLVVGAASLDEIAAITGGLGIDMSLWLGPASLPDLNQRELEALRTAATENGWPGGEAVDLLRAARLELARGGTRRLRLTSPADWIRFQETRRS
jgi:hypothetical protein